MLTFTDCVDFGHFSREDVRHIAQTEHVPDIVALELAESLYERHQNRRLDRLLAHQDQHKESLQACWR